MSKRYHVKDDVWLVREGHYLPDYAVVVGGTKVADLYFFRQKTARDVVIDCRLTWVETGVRINGFASYFADVLKFLRSVDWSFPAPKSVEAFGVR